MEMKFLVLNDAPREVALQRCYSESEHMIIPSQIKSNDTTYKITSIGEEAFSEEELASITIPNSVTSIGDYAFADCENLTLVKMQNPELCSSLNYDLVFAGCEKLNPSNVK